MCIMHGSVWHQAVSRHYIYVCVLFVFCLCKRFPASTPFADHHSPGAIANPPHRYHLHLQSNRSATSLSGVATPLPLSLLFPSNSDDLKSVSLRFRVCCCSKDRCGAEYGIRHYENEFLCDSSVRVCGVTDGRSGNYTARILRADSL